MEAKAKMTKGERASHIDRGRQRERQRETERDTMKQRKTKNSLPKRRREKTIFSIKRKITS